MGIFWRSNAPSTSTCVRVGSRKEWRARQMNDYHLVPCCHAHNQLSCSLSHHLLSLFHFQPLLFSSRLFSTYALPVPPQQRIRALIHGVCARIRPRAAGRAGHGHQRRPSEALVKMEENRRAYHTRSKLGEEYGQIIDARFFALLTDICCKNRGQQIVVSFHALVCVCVCVCVNREE